MTRIAIKLVVFLLLGAVVNVGVAWGCTWSDIRLVEVWKDDLPEPYVRWFDRTSNSVDVGDWPSPWGGNEGLGLGITMTAIWAGDSDPDEKPYRGMTALLYRVGWPMRALSMSWWHERLLPSEGVVRRSSTRKGSFEMPIREDRVFLPHRPIFPGFAINTLFYALMFWLLLSAPFTAPQAAWSLHQVWLRPVSRRA